MQKPPNSKILPKVLILTFLLHTKCMLRAFLSPGCNRLCVSSINVFSLEQTSLGANETGSSVKQSCIDICSDGATLPSSSGYFQKYMVFSKKHECT